MGCLVRRDRLFALERPRDVVKALEERLLRKRVEREGQPEPARMRDLERLEVDRQLVLLLHGRDDAREVVGRERDDRESRLERVGAKDVAERRRENDSEAVVLERPRGVLARGATAEVAPGDEDRRAL